RQGDRYGRPEHGVAVNAAAGAELDLLMQRISNARLQLRFDTPNFAIVGEAMRVSPVLSSDSIFLYFATAPRDELKARIDLTPAGALRYYASVLTDFYGLPIRQQDPGASAISTA